MPTPFESAQLNLQLFDLRREPLLREARAWFLADFNPESFEEMMAVTRGEKNPWFRMVLGYWDMACSMVTSGAIDAESFLAAHGEVFGAFSKIQPFLGKLREVTHESTFRNLEAVVMAAPDAETKLEKRRVMFRAAAKARAQKAAESAGAN